jgi:hypothetical protein
MSAESLYPWQTTEPPKDGRLILVYGRVIYSDGCCTSVDVIKPSLVRWSENQGESKGWHYLGGLSVALDLSDEVRINGWMEVNL